MTPTCESNPKVSRDLARGWSAWIYWYLPGALLLTGAAWEPGQVWLWTPAFAVMGAACLANAARCGRTHCYVTGPLFVLAALWTLYSALSRMPLYPNRLLAVVVGVSVLAHLAEIPFGRYRRT